MRRVSSPGSLDRRLLPALGIALLVALAPWPTLAQEEAPAAPRIALSASGFEIGRAVAFDGLEPADRKLAKQRGYSKNDRVWIEPDPLDNVEWRSLPWRVVERSAAANGPRFEVVAVHLSVDSSGRGSSYSIAKATFDLPDAVVASSLELGYASAEDIRFRFDKVAREMVMLPAAESRGRELP